MSGRVLPTIWGKGLGIGLPPRFWSLMVVFGTIVALAANNLPTNAGDVRDTDSGPWVRKIPWKRTWQPTPVFLPGESHGQRSLAGYSPYDHKELDMSEAT